MFGLSVTLFIVLILFLSGVEATSSKAACKAVSLLLHFFLLSMFGWMASHALLVYYKFVDIFGSSRNFRRIVVALCGGETNKNLKIINISFEQDVFLQKKRGMKVLALVPEEGIKRCIET